jgi:hypothetical protein
VIETILIVALCSVFFMLGRCYEEFVDMFAEAEVWEHPVTGARFISYR